MPISITCPDPKCRRQYQVRDDMAGKQVRCACGQVVAVPAAGPPLKRAKPRPTAGGKGPAPADPETAPAAPEGGSSARTAILALAVGAFLALLLVGGGGVALYAYLHGKPTPVVQLTPDGPTNRPDPATVPGNSGGATAPVKQLTPADTGRKDDTGRGRGPGPGPVTDPGSNKPSEHPMRSITSVGPSARRRPVDLLESDKLMIKLPDFPPDVKVKTPDVWDGHTNHVRGVAFDYTGNYVISVSGDVYVVEEKGRQRPPDYTLRVWDPLTGKQLHKSPGFKEALDACSVSPGGRYAVFGHGGYYDATGHWVNANDPSVHMWDIENNKEIHRGQPLTEKDWKPEGGREPQPRFQGLQPTVFATTFSPDGKTVFGGDNWGNAILWNTESGQPMFNPSMVQPDPRVDYEVDVGVKTVRYNLRGRSLYQDVPQVKQVPLPGVKSARFSPGGRYLFMACYRSLRLFEAQKGRPLGPLPPSHTDTVWAVDVTEVEGELLAISGGGGRWLLDGSGYWEGTKDYTIRLWHLPDGQMVKEFDGKGHEGDVMALAFCPNGRHFVSGSFDKTVRLWDVKTGKMLRILGRHDDPVRCVAVSPNGRAGVSGGDDCKVRFWRLPAPGPDLKEAVEKDDLGAFKKAIEDLELMGPEDLIAYPELVKVLTQADSKFRAPAAGALARFAEYCEKNNGSLKPPQVVELVKALKSAETPEERYAVALAAGVIGPDAKEAVPLLCEVATGGDGVKVVGAAVKALGKIGDPSREAVAALEKALQHSKPAVRAEAVAALVRFGPEHVKLKTFLDLVAADSSPEVRNAAEKALRGKLASLTKDDVPQLCEALKSSKTSVCIISADAVAKLGEGGEGAVPELAALLKRDDREVLVHAIQALGAVGKGAKSASGELVGLAEKLHFARFPPT